MCTDSAVVQAAVVQAAVVQALNRVRERIRRAAEQHGRDPEGVRLLAVSKHQPVEKIRAAYAAGQRDFGENYAQELLDKRAALADLADVRLHMIGHLQRNKVASLMGAISAVHSVDSERLVAELGKRAQARAVPAGLSLGEPGRLLVFIEVNLAGEANKGGCAPEALGKLLQAVRAQPSLSLAGLMAIPPGGGEASESRRHFQTLVALREAHGGAAVLPELSIGMSRDLEVAVECGSSWVRVGTDLFGARD
jgi:pyridoxal phosphate enzyme (YggS family)